ncbi:Ribosomal lysine N-methyltransferase [Lachnellula occidentalis]|uniref:Ribosomal lysine N-methyltransferase n=1 Tax=Lachnellula occidentalis TaxID=215460 RepID=A0A8H8S8J0_9HELO|nr:Ribosomal lysine N-methyltransferase [Lachnellula occidentalis]
METDEFTAATAAFVSWLSEIGVRINPKMIIKDLRAEGRGRGVVAAADFAEDEVVFSVPRSAVLNVSNALPGISDNPSKDAISKMPNWLALTAAMVTEGQRSDSRWAPYLAILPRQLESLVFWSESELRELQASTVVEKIGRKGAEQMFAEHITPLDERNVELHHRVASIIMAYAFDIPEDGEEKEPERGGDADELISDDGEDEKTVLSMIPLADMLNADADRNNARLCSDNEELEMRTIKPVVQGEEIFNDYGQLPRSDLLRRYGYVTDNYAAYDVAELTTQSICSRLTEGPLTLPSGKSMDPLSRHEIKTRLEIAEREGVYELSYDLAYPGPDGPAIPDELLALLYIILLDDENLKALISSQTVLPSRSKLSTELVGQVLAVLLERRLKDYSTTIEEDEKLLQQSKLPHRTTMAVNVRLGEKRVLREAMQAASKFDGSNARMMSAAAAARGSHTGKRKAEETSNPKKKGRFT